MRTSFKSIKSILLIAIVVGLYSCRVDSEIIPLGTARLNAPLELATPTNPYYGNYTIPPNNPTTVIGVELGRMLFYENMLSKDNTMSCASCHQQEFGFTDGKAVSPGVDGISGNRSTMALANLLWDNEFFWDGRSLGLEHQALGPIQNPIELNETLPVVISKLQAHDAYPQLFFLAFGDSIISSDNLDNAISQFERTLISSDSKFDKFLRGETTLTEAENEWISAIRSSSSWSNQRRKLWGLSFRIYI